MIALRMAITMLINRWNGQVSGAGNEDELLVTINSCDLYIMLTKVIESFTRI